MILFTKKRCTIKRYVNVILAQRFESQWPTPRPLMIEGRGRVDNADVQSRDIPSNTFVLLAHLNTAGVYLMLC